MKLVQIKVEYSQAHEMATAFGAPPLGILLANSAKLIRASEGRRKLDGGGARAQPPGQVEEDCSRPGRDDGPEFATGPIPVRRHFRARAPAAPANIPRASGALGVCQQYSSGPLW